IAILKNRDNKITGYRLYDYRNKPVLIGMPGSFWYSIPETKDSYVTRYDIKRISDTQTIVNISTINQKTSSGEMIGYITNTSTGEDGKRNTLYIDRLFSVPIENGEYKLAEADSIEVLPDGSIRKTNLPNSSIPAQLITDNGPGVKPDIINLTVAFRQDGSIEYIDGFVSNAVVRNINVIPVVLRGIAQERLKKEYNISISDREEDKGNFNCDPGRITIHEKLYANDLRGMLIKIDGKPLVESVPVRGPDNSVIYYVHSFKSDGSYDILYNILDNMLLLVGRAILKTSSELKNLLEALPQDIRSRIESNQDIHIIEVVFGNTINLYDKDGKLTGDPITVKIALPGAMPTPEEQRLFREDLKKCINDLRQRNLIEPSKAEDLLKEVDVIQFLPRPQGDALRQQQIGGPRSEIGYYEFNENQPGRGVIYLAYLNSIAEALVPYSHEFRHGKTGLESRQELRSLGLKPHTIEFLSETASIRYHNRVSDILIKNRLLDLLIPSVVKPTIINYLVAELGGELAIAICRAYAPKLIQLSGYLAQNATPGAVIAAFKSVLNDIIEDLKKAPQDVLSKLEITPEFREDIINQLEELSEATSFEFLNRLSGQGNVNVSNFEMLTMEPRGFAAGPEPASTGPIFGGKQADQDQRNNAIRGIGEILGLPIAIADGENIDSLRARLISGDNSIFVIFKVGSADIEEYRIKDKTGKIIARFKPGKYLALDNDTYYQHTNDGWVKITKKNDETLIYGSQLTFKDGSQIRRPYSAELDSRGRMLKGTLAISGERSVMAYKPNGETTPLHITDRGELMGLSANTKIEKLSAADLKKRINNNNVWQGLARKGIVREAGEYEVTVSKKDNSVTSIMIDGKRRVLLSDNIAVFLNNGEYEGARKVMFGQDKDGKPTVTEIGVYQRVDKLIPGLQAEARRLAGNRTPTLAPTLALVKDGKILEVLGKVDKNEIVLGRVIGEDVYRFDNKGRLATIHGTRVKVNEIIVTINYDREDNIVSVTYSKWFDARHERVSGQKTVTMAEIRAYAEKFNYAQGGLSANPEDVMPMLDGLRIEIKDKDKRSVYIVHYQLDDSWVKFGNVQNFSILVPVAMKMWDTKEDRLKDYIITEHTGRGENLAGYIMYEGNQHIQDWRTKVSWDRVKIDDHKVKVIETFLVAKNNQFKVGDIIFNAGNAVSLLITWKEAEETKTVNGKELKEKVNRIEKVVINGQDNTPGPKEITGAGNIALKFALGQMQINLEEEELKKNSDVAVTGTYKIINGAGLYLESVKFSRPISIIFTAENNFFNIAGHRFQAKGLKQVTLIIEQNGSVRLNEDVKLVSKPVAMTREKALRARGIDPENVSFEGRLDDKVGTGAWALTKEGSSWNLSLNAELKVTSKPGANTLRLGEYTLEADNGKVVSLVIKKDGELTTENGAGYRVRMPVRYRDIVERSGALYQKMMPGSEVSFMQQAGRELGINEEILNGILTDEGKAKKFRDENKQLYENLSTRALELYVAVKWGKKEIYDILNQIVDDRACFIFKGEKNIELVSFKIGDKIHIFNTLPMAEYVKNNPNKYLKNQEARYEIIGAEITGHFSKDPFEKKTYDTGYGIVWAVKGLFSSKAPSNYTLLGLPEPTQQDITKGREYRQQLVRGIRDFVNRNQDAHSKAIAAKARMAEKTGRDLGAGLDSVVAPIGNLLVNTRFIPVLARDKSGNIRFFASFNEGFRGDIQPLVNIRNIADRKFILSFGISKTAFVSPREVGNGLVNLGGAIRNAAVNTWGTSVRFIAGLPDRKFILSFGISKTAFVSP
ncbi:MAG: hypothetical protein AAB267_07540, partial [Candidatus Desantisbacteria bacterium]